MQYLVRNVRTPLEREPDLKGAVARKLRIAPATLCQLTIRRRAVDARKRNEVRWCYTLLVTFTGEPPTHPDVQPWSEPEPETLSPQFLSAPHPFIVGAGPAGLFAALALAERGFLPWIFDRGDPLSERTRAVQQFTATGELDPDSNVQFGEGGAGAFSDGKLTARSQNVWTEAVFERLVRFGASPDILVNALPHLGTDGMRAVVAGIRAWLEQQGCRFFWRAPLTGLTLANGRVTRVTLGGEEYSPEALLLGVGNAARQTFRMLYERGIAMHTKPFAVGFRLEHEQAFLNDFFYGPRTNFTLTGPATYRLVTRAGERGVYSFCMCPGGEVLAAASEPGGQVVNGMSWANRAARWANSAIVAQVGPADYGSGPLDGVRFQEEIERRAWRTGFAAPVQSAAEYIGAGRATGAVRSSYRPAIVRADLGGILPPALDKALRAGLRQLDRRGFVRQGLLLAVETRTSCPVRMVRSEQTLASVSAENLFPIGEGAGYAGGIVSSAADGWRTASQFEKGQ